MSQTLLDKIWSSHRVHSFEDHSDLIYIDRHLVHEVTSPQAFDGLRVNGRKVRRPDLTLATMDHNVPTLDPKNIQDQIAKLQIETLEKNCAEFGIKLFGLDSDKQGIVHVIGPELGFTLPGTTIVCGDSHTSTHGAFGALAFGIGTSEVEHVLATQCLISNKPKSFRVEFEGHLAPGLTSKDLILHLIHKIGTAGGTGHVFEFCGQTIHSLTMEARLSLCNMSIEGGARAGMIAPDDVTFQYLVHPQRVLAPRGENLDSAIQNWKALHSDDNAQFDKSITINVSSLAPQITWGTNPAMVADIDGVIPNPDNVPHSSAEDARKAMNYMGVTPGQKITDLDVDVVFIGSCTNSRIEDLRAAANVFKNHKVKAGVQTLIVPGSQLVKKQAEAEGLDRIFKAAGAEWRTPGCSMCLAMNPDKLQPGQRCASTSNRNFEGRQGSGGRTHLVSPIMAAAAAIHGKFVDVRKLKNIF